MQYAGRFLWLLLATLLVAGCEALPEPNGDGLEISGLVYRGWPANKSGLVKAENAEITLTVGCTNTVEVEDDSEGAQESVFPEDCEHQLEFAVTRGRVGFELGDLSEMYEDGDDLAFEEVYLWEDYLQAFYYDEYCGKADTSYSDCPDHRINDLELVIEGEARWDDGELDLALFYAGFKVVETTFLEFQPVEDDQEQDRRKQNRATHEAPTHER